VILRESLDTKQRALFVGIEDKAVATRHPFVQAALHQCLEQVTD
jgi:hypothetical protein